jgi:hypothetical protein
LLGFMLFGTFALLTTWAVGRWYDESLSR